MTGDSPTTESSLECNSDGVCDPGETEQNCMADCVVPPGCGDGVKNGAETCDDGEANGEYGKCKADCSGTTSCGDGKQNGPEKCDDGPDNNNDYSADPHCNADCSALAPHCGDTTCEPSQEDGNSCTMDCKPGCGNGLAEPGETCDEGMADTPTCDADCTAIECGDGRINMASGETCEDGNDATDDDCVSCKAAVCGDGFVWAGMEECDDGNEVETDLCDNACKPVIERKVFVSSQGFTGNLKGTAENGLAGADKKCQGLATTADLPGTFKAWISDGATGPAKRFDQTFTGVYKLVDGTPVAIGWTGLTTKALEHAIDLTETNEAMVEANVWTNTNAVGIPLMGTNHCTNWTSSKVQEDGSHGSSFVVDASWTDAMKTTTCDHKLRLYCFEDLP